MSKRKKNVHCIHSCDVTLHCPRNSREREKKEKIYISHVMQANWGYMQGNKKIRDEHCFTMIFDKEFSFIHPIIHSNKLLFFSRCVCLYIFPEMLKRSRHNYCAMPVWSQFLVIVNASADAWGVLLYTCKLLIIFTVKHSNTMHHMSY